MHLSLALCLPGCLCDVCDHFMCLNGSLAVNTLQRSLNHQDFIMRKVIFKAFISLICLLFTVLLCSGNKQEKSLCLLYLLASMILFAKGH